MVKGFIAHVPAAAYRIIGTSFFVGASSKLARHIFTDAGRKRVFPVIGISCIGIGAECADPVVHKSRRQIWNVLATVATKIFLENNRDHGFIVQFVIAPQRLFVIAIIAIGLRDAVVLCYVHTSNRRELVLFCPVSV